MNAIYNHIVDSMKRHKKLLAVLIDPDKITTQKVLSFIEKVNASMATHIFVGGSTVKSNVTSTLVNKIKSSTNLPIVLFPGSISQITTSADALLFLSLISGRNADYLIGKQIEAVSKLREINLEIIPTGYVLIESGKKTAVQEVTKTSPMPRHDINAIVDTAVAGEFLGMRMIYLEAGSGALNPINANIISNVKKALKIPLIVGGGIKNKSQIQVAYDAGADLVVVGNALEHSNFFLNDAK